uniref:Reverse transcriptase Ty1/copia-type domain-containing protein n=1 Tax=Cannabis sativa TaxID=3483 RepID=A0A803PT18_CANSA
MKMEYATKHLEESLHVESIVEAKDSAQKEVDAELEDNKDQTEVKEQINENEPVRLKARLVAKDFTQAKGIDYIEIFSPVVNYNMTILMSSLATQIEFEVDQVDVKIAFQNEFLDEKIYMKQPHGFQKKSSGKLVFLQKDGSRWLVVPTLKGLPDIRLQLSLFLFGKTLQHVLQFIVPEVVTLSESTLTQDSMEISLRGVC